MSAGELSEHAAYLVDEVKLAAYETALRAHLGPAGGTVLDLGAGTGILGLLAARAGATTVLAVDSGPIIGPARDAAALSGWGDRFLHLRARSTELELDEPVDVAVCDQIGGFVHDAGILTYFADARRRLLRDGGVLVPAAFRLFLAPATCDAVRDQIALWRSHPGGFDLSPFHTAAVECEHPVEADQVVLLAAGAHVASIASDHVDPIVGRATTTVATAGRCDGLVGWFEAEMGGDATLTNRPDAAVRMRRWCTFYPLEEPLDVVPGDVVEAGIDVRPLIHAVSWTTSVRTADGETRRAERHSTLLGTFVSRDDLARAGGTPIGATARGRALARALALADGTRSTAEVLAALATEGLVGDGTGTDEQWVRDELERLATPVDR